VASGKAERGLMEDGRACPAKNVWHGFCYANGKIIKYLIYAKR
jgi:hypothetical protein